MFWGVLSLCLSVVFLVLTLLGARHPGKPKWASDLMVQYVWVIVILGLASTGLILIALAFSGDATSVTTQEYLLSLAIAAATAILVKLFGVNKKLASYAARGGTA